jgi:lysozyme
MRVSNRGLAFVAGLEGVVTKAYRDVAGVWTIGVGHTAAAGEPKPRAGMTISRAQAFEILARDVSGCEPRVADALGAASQQAFDGAVSFDFNTGAVQRASWVKAYRDGNLSAARADLMQWVKAGGRTVAGLVRRREAEARLIFDGAYGPPAAGVHSTGEVAAYQRQLATLGFLVGPVDGIAGPATKAAVLAYQRGRGDLVADGIAGPATLASLARDVAALAKLHQVGAATVGSVVAGGAAGLAQGGNPLAWGVVAGLALLVIVGGFFVWRYRGELRRLLFARKGL